MGPSPTPFKPNTVEIQEEMNKTQYQLREHISKSIIKCNFDLEKIEDFKTESEVSGVKLSNNKQLLVTI